MIASVKMVPVAEIEEGFVLDLYEDEYNDTWSDSIDTESPFEVVDISYEEEEIVFINENDEEIKFPYGHHVRVLRD